MKKWMKRVLALSFVLCLLSIPTMTVYAGSVTSVSVSGANNKITVSGTTDASVLACAVLVYDSAGTNLLGMETCAASGGAYSYTLTQNFAAGTYMIKVADYNGGDYATANVTVTGTTTVAAATTSTATVATTAKSPKTGQNTLPVVLALLSGMLAVSLIVCKKNEVE